jgi:hypothetical protein
MNVGVLLMVVSIGLSAVVQIFTDPRITKEFAYKSLIALAVYAAHIAIGTMVLLFLLPHAKSPYTPVGATVAILGWIGLGALGLVRFAPRLREPPRFLLQVGIADAVFLAMIAGGIAAAAGLF